MRVWRRLLCPDFLWFANLKYVKLGYHYLINHDIHLVTIPVLVADLHLDLYNSHFILTKKLIGLGNGFGSCSKFSGPNSGPGCNRFKNFGTCLGLSSTGSWYGPSESKSIPSPQLSTRFFYSTLPLISLILPCISILYQE